MSDTADDRVKYVTILRHGKAVRGDDYPVDFDRPLAKRGQKDLARIVKVLAQINPPVDWIVTSPARRARQSAEIVVEGLAYETPLIMEDAIYELGAEAVMALLEQIPPDVHHALVVGHNPTLERLVSGLCAGSQTRLPNSLPTSGVVTIELQIMRWEQVRHGCGQLRLYLRPRLLRGL